MIYGKNHQIEGPISISHQNIMGQIHKTIFSVTYERPP
jgi:hypothetical protein